MAAFIGRRIRASTAPSGSEMIEATASAALDSQLVAAFQPLLAAPLILPQIPPSAKAANLVPVSPPGMCAPLEPRAAAFIRCTAAGPPTAFTHSGRMIASPPDRASAPPPSGEKK